MFLKEMTAERGAFAKEPSSNTTYPMKSMHLRSMQDLLRHTMGMSHTAAATTAFRAQRHDHPRSYMRKFLQAAIKDQIDEYRMQNFAKFGLDIEVLPTPNAKRMKLPVEHFGEATIGYHSYSFCPKHNAEPSKTLRVRLHQGGIQVHFCAYWRPLSAYLNEVSTDWTYSAAPSTELSRQCYWWMSNGKSFDIMNLPGEIRNAIFDFAFPAEAHPFHASECAKRGRLVPNFGHSHTALMRTNKQLYQEASDRFYKMTTFTIGNRQLFSKTLNNRFLRDRLRHVRLSLTHSEYLDLFSSKPWDLSTKPYAKWQLREMPNLTSLEIHIGAPSRIPTKVWFEGACQITAVNMIMDAAWPSIRGLPVTITGYVKDSQKKAIEAHVQSERNTYALFGAWCRDIGKRCSLSAYDDWVEWMMAEEHGGVRLDGEPCVEAEAGEDNKLQWNCMTTQDLRMVMWCSCEKRCSLDTWDPAD